jgi:hypothetical protein
MTPAFAAVADGFRQLGDNFSKHVQATSHQAKTTQSLQAMSADIDKLKQQFAKLDNTEAPTAALWPAVAAVSNKPTSKPPSHSVPLQGTIHAQRKPPSYNQFLARVAQLNGVSTADTDKAFAVAPSVQQKLENAMQESSAFLRASTSFPWMRCRAKAGPVPVRPHRQPHQHRHKDRQTRDLTGISGAATTASRPTTTRT